MILANELIFYFVKSEEQGIAPLTHYDNGSITWKGKIK
jgi:hypothetical protein